MTLTSKPAAQGLEPDGEPPRFRSGYAESATAPVQMEPACRRAAKRPPCCQYRELGVVRPIPAIAAERSPMWRNRTAASGR